VLRLTVGASVQNVNLEGDRIQDVVIYDVNGVRAAACPARGVTDHVYDIKLPGLAPGVYVLVARMANRIQTVRFVVLD
jgi:hypothetical protein